VNQSSQSANRKSSASRILQRGHVPTDVTRRVRRTTRRGTLLTRHLPYNPLARLDMCCSCRGCPD